LRTLPASGIVSEPRAAGLLALNGGHARAGCIAKTAGAGHDFAWRLNHRARFIGRKLQTSSDAIIDLDPIAALSGGLVAARAEHAAE
jgi:hypothetical protein